MFQTGTPVITSALVEELHVKSAVPKPTAKGTPLRYSSAMSCQRQQSYAAINANATEPMDEAGAWATGLGTIIHEALQDCLGRKFPSAQFEVASQFGDVSGSCDALISVEDFEEPLRNNLLSGTHILYELKTMGTYSFDKQVGWNRMKSYVSEGEGPALKAITQAGMNALGIMSENPNIDIQWLVMGSITFEALSKNKASSMGIDGTNRFLAEYYVPAEEWRPMAELELNRMGALAYTLGQGYLADRVAQDDNGNSILLDPLRGRAWQCDYCAFRSLCITDGQGQVRVMDSNAVAREEAQ